MSVHSLETHNFHIKRYGRCPYCDLGSDPVPKDVIEQMVRDGKLSWSIGVNLEVRK